MMVRIWVLLMLLSLLDHEAAAISRKKFKSLFRASQKKKVCMRDIGCFELTTDFEGRPINILPQDRRLINTQFFLYTRNNPSDKHVLIGNKPKTLIHSPIDVSLPTKLIVHGFLDTQFFGTWQTEMKDELMRNDEYNIIVVDWSGGNQLPYSQAAANARVVGAEIAFLITQLQKYVNLTPESCHIIGHSLGAHVAGYAGEKLTKLRRITALDPAEPYFQDMPPSVRIDPTDAQFVDVIHTDSDSIYVLGLGMRQLVGHVDFFPNNGRSQPGCEIHHRILSIITEGVVEGIRRLSSCSHQRAVDFFKSSINTVRCQYVAHHCSNWTEFLSGKCSSCGPDGSECAVMGLHADEFKVKNPNDSIQVFLKTDDNAPFCVHHYKVIVHLSAKGEKSHKGKIKLGVRGENDEKSTVTISSQHDDLTPGNNLTYLLVTPFQVDSEKPIEFSWTSDSWLSFYQLNLDSVEIISMDYFSDKDQIENSRVYYQLKDGPIKESRIVEMYSGENEI